MATEEPTSNAPREPVVEYKKDGTVSRMRSHKGNIPQLPQTKLCPFCPAKFTRTTHLNRHLRNHTNERLYRCEACGSQFTRSDLLARHKKSCGDSSNNHVSRSRRRSCQVCAALKVKCDLRQPCGKCKARSRECIYPAENPDDVQSGPSRTQPTGIANVDASAGFVPSQASFPGEGQKAAFPELSLIEESSSSFMPPLSEANLSSFLSMQSSSNSRPGAMSLPTIGDAESTINTAPSFFAFDNRAFTSFVPSDIAAPSSAPGLGTFSNDMFEPFFRDVFNTGTSTASQPNPLTTPLTFNNSVPAGSSMEQQSMQVEQPSLHSLFSGFDGLQAFDSNGSTSSADPSQTRSNVDPDLLLDMMAASHTDPAPPPRARRSSGLHSEIANINPGTARSTYTQDELLSVLQPPPPPPTDEAVPDPTEAELQQYMHVFLELFLPQIPIVHIPTLRVELKPPVLIRSMQACGALFAKTKVADAFVERTLAMREKLVREFAKPSDNPKHQMYIIMTLIFLQTIGLFHQSPQQRASSNLYHGMLVLMIRQNRVLERSAAWKMPTFPIPDPEALDAAWHDWTIHEAIKRSMLLAYTQDQSHQIFFALPASFAPNEFSIRLPCEEALWSAPSAFAWSQLLLAESPYGSISQRLLGIPMLHGMAALSLEGGHMDSADPFKDVGTMPPFAHFIIMHALLGELFRRCNPADSPALKPDGQEEEVNPHVFSMQLALHKWLKLWLLNPDAPLAAAPNGHVEPGAKSVTYTTNPLPFYWLGQLLLLAFQEGLPPFALEPPAVPDNGLSPKSRTLTSSHSPPASTSTASSPFSPYSPFDAAPSLSSASSSSTSPPPGSSSVPDPSVVPAERSDGPTSLFYAGPNYVPPAGQKRRMQTDAASAQFSLIKNWLQHIRSFLRRSEGSPTVVWDELMRIRLSGWYADTNMKACRRMNQLPGSVDEEDAEAHGLLGFFEEKLKI